MIKVSKFIINDIANGVGYLDPLLHGVIELGRSQDRKVIYPAAFATKGRLEQTTIFRIVKQLLELPQICSSVYGNKLSNSPFFATPFAISRTHDLKSNLCANQTAFS